MKTAEEIFKKHYEKVTGKPCGNMELDHMSYAIDAMKEYAEQSRPEVSENKCKCQDSQNFTRLLCPSCSAM
jgi:hypothetical protein